MSSTTCACSQISRKLLRAPTSLRLGVRRVLFPLLGPSPAGPPDAVTTVHGSLEACRSGSRAGDSPAPLCLGQSQPTEGQRRHTENVRGYSGHNPGSAEGAPHSVSRARFPLMRYSMAVGAGNSRLQQDIKIVKTILCVNPLPFHNPNKSSFRTELASLAAPRASRDSPWSCCSLHGIGQGSFFPSAAGSGAHSTPSSWAEFRA